MSPTLPYLNDTLLLGMAAIFLSIINTTLVQEEGEGGEESNNTLFFASLRLKLRRFQNKAPLVKKRGDIEDAERKEEKKGKPMNNEC